jgi:hypothetical protein
MMSRLWVALLLVVALGATQADAITYAWWLTAQFTPEGQSVEGLPLSAVDTTWTAASVLREEMFPPEARQSGESVADHGGHLTLAIDLDGDRRPEKAVVGVYRDRAGVTGRFLLILATDSRGRLRRKALFAEPGSPGFSALFLWDKTLHWAFCMECDSSCAIVNRRASWTLDCESCCEEE